MKVVFKSGPTLHSLLTKVKDPLPKEKLACVVYQIPCKCGKVYIGETQRCLVMRVKEHRDTCTKKGVYLEVCHRGALMGLATPSRLGWDEGAGQGH